MPQSTPASDRRCPDCAGFSAVVVTTGTRHPDGSRATVRVLCRTCDGTGTVDRRPRVLPAGR